jgi:uncharacterized SAM-binding protein YcdF (DUF218 family)
MPPWVRRGIATLVTLLLVWIVGGWFVIVRPATDRPAPVDAILVLGPPRPNGRFAEAYSLIQAGYSKNLVVSVATYGEREIRTACQSGVAGVPTAKVYCFKPDPATTRGEAQKIAALASEHGWSRIMVVTATYHVSRARVIVRRCFHGTVLMEAAHSGITLREWSYEYLYQTGAYLKVLLHPSC